MLQMKKPDIAALGSAHDGTGAASTTAAGAKGSG